MSDDLRDEYQFDYRQAKPNRFAAALKKGGRLVVLDPDVTHASVETTVIDTNVRNRGGPACGARRTVVRGAGRVRMPAGAQYRFGC